MPGIVGIIESAECRSEENALDSMIKCMFHEPFYESGTYVNRQLGLQIGWACHQSSFSDCMPVWNEKKDVCLIFFGEDFTDPDELKILKANGHNFDQENASYLVHLYEEKGIDFIKSLNGWFSGLLIDLRKKRIFIFNDRYGLGRIYFYEKCDQLYFASEAKSLLKVLPELRRLNYKSLAEAFSCGCVLQDKTLFSEIRLVPAGSIWAINENGKLRKDSYFDLKNWQSQPLLKENEFYQQFRETFRRILPRYFRGKKQVGMSLTGGLDGRMIMAWANRFPGELPCYSFSGIYRDCADVKIARKLAKLCGQSHETIVVGPQFFSEFPRLAEQSVYISDGTMDVTGSVELYVNKMARQIAPIRLTGNYGSEIIRRNIAFRPASLYAELIEPEFGRLVKNAAATYDSECRGNELSFIAFKQVPWHHYSRLSVEQSQLTLRSPFLDNELVYLMYKAPQNFSLSPQPILRLIAEGNGELAKIPTDRGLLCQPTPIIGNFRHLYQELTYKSEYAYDYGMPQWLARIDRIIEPLHVERLFMGRQKFYHFRVWYRDKLNQYVKDILLEQRSLERPYIQRKYLEKMVNSHLAGKRNYTQEISRILSFELIQRHLIEHKR